MPDQPRESTQITEHWLARPQTIRWLWWSFAALLAGTVIADLFVTHHPKFGIEGTFGFGAWFGFVSCTALIVFSKALGVILKRPENYYDD